MRDETNTTTDRMEAAKAAAPYVHPRLSSVAATMDASANIRAWMVSAQEWADVEDCETEQGSEA
jgi:hypothetical protein